MSGTRRALRTVGVGLAAGVAASLILAGVAAYTRPVREAVQTYTALLDAANRQDVDAVRALCSARYLATHRLERSEEGGVVGLPRNIHKNFRAWRERADAVWLCPTNRVGPVYQFVPGPGGWKFDGPVGLLRPRGEFVPVADESEPEPSAPAVDPTPRRRERSHPPPVPD